MRRLLATAVLLGVFLWPALARAAEPLRIEIISVDEQKGRLTVVLSTTGSDGKAVPSLTPGNFQASIDGAPIKVTETSGNAGARAPVSIVLLVDVSGSMAGNPITQARLALTEFAKAIDPSDQVSLIAFDTAVKPLQDFTSDRALLTQNIAKLTPLGDTALFDAVTAGVTKATTAPTARRVVVLLSDGEATVGLDKRAASLDAAKAAGVPVVAIGLGAGIDRAYLRDLATASGGRFLEAPTPATLRQAYVDLAAYIKGQYTLTMTVPDTVDRSIAGKLTVRLTLGADTTTAERVLPPLAGAVPPPFTLSIEGVAASQRLTAPATVGARAPDGIAVTRIEYFIDGQSAFVAEQPPFTYDFDPAGLAGGNHLLKVVATDARGRTGEKQIVFVAGAPAGGGVSIPPALFAVVGLFVLVGVAGWLVVRYRARQPQHVEGRVHPWAKRFKDPIPLVLDAAPPEEVPDDEPVRPVGRVVVMNESEVRSGHLDAIREYEVSSRPLTLGTGSTCDIELVDPEGRIAGEEARLWVQRGRLVFHKLTTLSAMATEGVTTGWQIIETGEEIHIGQFRIGFELYDEPEPAPSSAEPEPVNLSRLVELWPTTGDNGPVGAS